MLPTRVSLRHFARAALEKHGYVGVRSRIARGTAPGARLVAQKRNGAQFEIAVRTSLRREAGFTKTADGNWRTISEVDLVLVSVPGGKGAQAEVYCFQSKILIKFLDKIVEQHESLDVTSPIFVAVDAIRPRKSRAIGAGLSEIAKWHEPFSEPTSSWDALIDRTKREAANIIGINPDQVRVEIKIFSPGDKSFKAS
jgi:hypothetical protein